MRVANSYKGYEFDETKAYGKSGKMYVSALGKCDRCTKGVFVCRVENGQPVPHPNAGGVCFKCGGTGFVTKEIRLYTDKEFEQMEKANARAAEKKTAAREEKMKAEYVEKKAKWIEENGFNENLTTFIYFPSDSYNVKETLKDNGFRFNSFLLWHAATLPVGYEESCIEVSFDEIGEFSAWGEGHYSPDVKKIITSKIEEARPASASDWIGEEKDRIVDLPVTLVSVRGFESRFGYSQVVNFLNGDNVIVWFTATNINFEPGDELLLSGTIKTLDEYKGIRQTVMTRCKLKEV